MQGAGNDYIYVNTLRHPIADPVRTSIKWSSCHTGIGSDGLVLIGKSTKADFSMRIFNADGSEAMMCGNASRCIGKYVYDNKLTQKEVITLETLSGIKILKLHTENGLVEEVTVDMDLPLLTNSRQINTPDGKMLAKTITVDGKEYKGSSASSTTEATEAKEETKPKEKTEPESGTPVDNHGKLTLKGTDIVDKNGDKYQLKGVSTHGIAWFPEYVNQDAFQSLRDDMGANLIRIAMYSGENNGYCTGGDQKQLKELVKTGVDAATNLGMYVIIDWHVLGDQNPQTYKEEAKAFFEEMSSLYKDYDNVIYEICNEPNGGTTWADVKSYAEEVIPIIRKNTKDALIIVGTPTWSQDVDIAAEDPVTGYDNIMYAVHFYAATHTDNIRNKVTTALSKGLPIFVSEFSICDASGNGAIDYDQAAKWFDLIDSNNLSYAAWNLSNKAETSSLIDSSCTKTSGWTDEDYSETGKWLKKQMHGEN